MLFMDRTIRMLFRWVTAGFLSATVCLAGQQGSAVDSASGDGIYTYRVHGKVRLILFWVGRDDVGGGTIDISRKRDPASLAWTEEVGILFGSDPARVPGKINRWGYGRERSEWKAGAAGGIELQSTVFEGFMRHSKEESLSEIRANDNAEKAGSQFLFDGIRSMAFARAAQAEVWSFSTAKDFDFRDSSGLFCSYRERQQAGPPDRTRKLENRSSAYDQPYGFLTAVHAMVRLVVDKPSESQTWASRRPSVGYVYNAKVYRLSLRNLAIEDQFVLPVKDPVSGKAGSQAFGKVARMELNIKESQGPYNHDFTLWFPLQGPFRGIPLRVEDHPRWWLKLILDLAPGRELEARRPKTDCR
jgi:hypothetical protein